MLYPPELLRHQVVAVGASLLLSFLGIAVLVYGLSSQDASSTGFIAFGVVALLVGLSLAWLSSSWYRRAVRLVSAGQQTDATITLVVKSDSDSTTLYAQVSAVGKIADHSLGVAVLAPRWEYQSWLDRSQSARLFIEPSSSRLMAISTQRGMLWCIPHNVAARGLGQQAMGDSTPFS